MKYYGSLIGHVAEVNGIQLVVVKLITEESLWMSTCSILWNTNGQTGEFRLISRRSALHFGIINLKRNTHMMMKNC